MHKITSYRNILNVALPVILGILAENIINVTDTVFIGRINAEQPGALGAVGIGSLYYYTFVLIVLGLGMGTQIISARRNGEGHLEQAGRTLNSSLYIFFCIGLLLFLFLHFGTPYLLPELVSDNIYPMALEYILIRSYGIPLLSIAIVIRSFLIGITRTKVIIFITATMAVVNIIFNYLLIFGHGGFPALGVAGSAIASVIAEVVSMLGYLLLVTFWRKLKPYMLLRLRRPDLSLGLHVLKVGLPLMLQNWISVSSWLVFFLLIDKMGTHALDVSTIIKSVYILLMIPIWGFSSAANSLVSNAIGMQQPGMVKVLTKRIILLTVLTTFTIVQANIWAPEFVLGFFSDSPAVYADGSSILLIVSAAMLMLSVGGVLFHTVSGTGATRVSLYIEVVTLVLYFAYLFIATQWLELSLQMVWLSEWVYMGTMALLSFLYLRSGRWQGVNV